MRFHLGLFRILDRVPCSRHDRHSDLLHEGSGGKLAAQVLHGAGVRSDEHDAQIGRAHV